ncbi:MAG: response regulator [Acidobacteriaceae bacterium]
MHHTREACDIFESDMTGRTTRACLGRFKLVAETEAAPPKYTKRVTQMTELKEVRSQRPVRILLVDDQPACLATLGAVLTCNGYVVDTAVDGLDALMKLKRSLPDLIVSDLRMPRMSGFELLATVRQRFPHIASIAITGEVTGNKLSASLTDLLLEKGAYTPAELLRSIKDLLRRSPLRPRLPRLEITPACLPRDSMGAYGYPCGHCRRFFNWSDWEPAGEQRGVQCPFCGTELTYFIDPILATAADFRDPARQQNRDRCETALRVP